MSELVTDVRFYGASALDQAAGLEGFASVTVNGLRITGIAVRRARDGRRVLAFPSRRDRAGKKHPIVLPVDREMQQQIEDAIAAELERQGRLAS